MKSMILLAIFALSSCATSSSRLMNVKTSNGVSAGANQQIVVCAMDRSKNALLCLTPDEAMQVATQQQAEDMGSAANRLNDGSQQL